MPKITTNKSKKLTSVSGDDQIGLAVRPATPDDSYNVNERNELWKPGHLRPFTPQINFTTSVEKKSPTDVMIGQNLMTKRGVAPMNHKKTRQGY